MTLDEARDQFDELLTFASAGADRQVVIEQSGHPVAAIVPYHVIQSIERQRRPREERFAVLDTIGHGFDDVSDEDLQKEVDQAVARVRARRRVERQRALVTSE